MAVCNSCREAGNLLTEWKEEGKQIDPNEPWTEMDDSILTARVSKLHYLHEQCPGKAFCFCQHVVASVLSR